MGQRETVRVCYFIVLIMVSALYTNCSAKHSSLSDSSVNPLLLKCNAILEDEFQKGYYPFVKENCAACHVVGGAGNGAFADSLANIAFEAFNLRGATLVHDRAVDPNHQPSFTGPQHESTLAPMETAWAEAEARKKTCEDAVLTDNNGGGGDGVNPPPPAEAKIFTTAKTMSAGNNSTTLTWNLANEISEPTGISLAGVQFSITVQADETSTGDQYYQFSLPSLQTGNSNIRIAVIQIRINGEIETSATTYKGVNRIVVSGQNTNLTLTNMIVPRTLNAADTLAIGFGIIEETTADPIAPGVVRLSDLTFSGGVFANNCVSCHNAANANGGLVLTDHQLLIDSVRNYAIPGNPNGSLIIQRMTNAANPMPPTGLLNDSQISIVEDWIIDGALE